MLHKLQAPNNPAGSPMIMLVAHILIACSLPGMCRVFTHITWPIFSSALRDRFHHDSHYTNKAQRGTGKCPGVTMLGSGRVEKGPRPDSEAHHLTCHIILSPSHYPKLGILTPSPLYTLGALRSGCRGSLAHQWTGGPGWVPSVPRSCDSLGDTSPLKNNIY